MSLDRLQAILQSGDEHTGAYLQVDQLRESALYKTLKNTPYVASVAVKDAAIRSFEQTIAENLLRMQTFNVIFAVIIALGVVYNSARISFSERSRELATLRVIGFTRAEISMILLGELGVLVTAAIPLGLGIGTSLAWLSTQSMVETELFRIPLWIDRSTYAFSVVIIVTATVVSGLLVRRSLDQLDLIAVLKTRD
jgi:putative ABC transport system permease protein